MRNLFFILLVFLPAFSPSLWGSELEKVAKDLRHSARKTRMAKELEYAIADREEMLQAGLESKRIDPAEERKIRNALRKLRAMEKNMHKKGALSQNELKRFHNELAYCYHLISFASRKKGEFTYTLEGGKKFYLLPEYQRRADRASLSRKDMQEIHKVMNRVWRLRSQLKNKHVTAQEKKQILEDCTALLLEKYFTDQKPLPPVGNKKKGPKK